MTWNADDPFPAPAALGETGGGARNLPRFLCSLLRPGSVLSLGSCQVAVQAARRHDVTVVDWNRRRLTRLESAMERERRSVRLLCRDPERQDLGLPPRCMDNVVCVDVLERFRGDVIVLERLRRVLAPGGRLVVRARTGQGGVPDESGLRTYDPETLRQSLQAAGFRTLTVRYWNFVGTSARWMSALRSGSAPEPDRAHWYDGALDVWFRTVENRVGFPTGVSVVAVATPHLEKARARRPELTKSLSRRPAREAYEPLGTTR